MTRPTKSDPFVPNGESRRDTLELLLGTAEEFGIDAHAVKSDSHHRGFFITQELADVLYEETEANPIEGLDRSGVPLDADQDGVLDAFEGDPEPDDEDAFDVAGSSVDQVKAFVIEFPETLSDVLAAEQEGKNRVTLVEWLNHQTSGNRAEKNTDTEE